MEISELKIKSRVRYKNQLFSLTGVFVDENAEHYVKITNRKRTLRIPIQMIEPVKINAFWLVKFGFTKTYESGYLIRYERPVESLKFDFDFRDNDYLGGLKLYGINVNCGYVHQFQNLFCFLFGKDLL